MKVCIAFTTAALLLSATTALAAGGEGASPSEKPTSQVQIAMSLYVGGISLGSVDMDASFRGDDYHVVSNLTTSGVVNAFWQSHIQATATGKNFEGRISPMLYDSFYTGRNAKNQEVSLTFEGGRPRLYANPAFRKYGYEVSPDEQKNTFDPMGSVIAFVAGVRPDTLNPCGVILPVFDGLRRYNIEMSREKDADIKMDNGIYRGHVAVCEIKYNQIAGFSPGVLRAKQRFPKIYAWIAAYRNAAGRSLFLPLRFWADTEYGTISAVTDKLVIDGALQKAS